MRGFLPFPYSFLLLPAAVALGLAYLALRRPSRRRGPVRAGILLTVCALPFATTGPGQAQVILGLLAGYLALRMTALAQRTAPASLARASLALIHFEPIFEPRATPWPRPRWLAVRGVVEIATCIVLLWLGDELRLWARPWPMIYLDDILVLLEVGVGSAGIHHGVVGVAGLCGRPVRGLQDSPLASASLAEFWGRRWNHLVQSHLKEGVFRPILRAGHPQKAMLAAFAASGAFHLLALADGGPLPALLSVAAQIMGFFLLHGALVALERRMGWHRAPTRPWPLRVARARSLIVFVLVSPLLLGPYARLAHVHGRRVSCHRQASPSTTPNQEDGHHGREDQPAAKRDNRAGAQARRPVAHFHHVRALGNGERTKNRVGALDLDRAPVDGGSPAVRPFVEQNRIAGPFRATMEQHMLGRGSFDLAGRRIVGSARLTVALSA